MVLFTHSASVGCLDWGPLGSFSFVDLLVWMGTSGGLTGPWWPSIASLMCWENPLPAGSWCPGDWHRLLPVVTGFQMQRGTMPRYKRLMETLLTARLLMSHYPSRSQGPAQCQSEESTQGRLCWRPLCSSHLHVLLTAPVGGHLVISDRLVLQITL